MHHAFLADVGVPMIFIQWPLMICALVPVIVIEAVVVRYRLLLPFRKAFAGSAKANILSTLAGVPIAWGLMLILEFAIALPLGLAAEKWHWIGPAHSPFEYFLAILSMAWTVGSGTAIALAAALLLIPTFFVSVRLERRSYRRSWPDVDTAAVDRSVWLANLASYSLLFVAGCAWFIWEVHAISH